MLDGQALPYSATPQTVYAQSTACPMDLKAGNCQLVARLMLIGNPSPMQSNGTALLLQLT